MSDNNQDDIIWVTTQDFENNYVSRLSYDALRAEVEALRAENAALYEKVMQLYFEIGRNATAWANAIGDTQRENAALRAELQQARDSLRMTEHIDAVKWENETLPNIIRPMVRELWHYKAAILSIHAIGARPGGFTTKDAIEALTIANDALKGEGG